MPPLWWEPLSGFLMQAAAVIARCWEEGRGEAEERGGGVLGSVGERENIFFFADRMCAPLPHLLPRTLFGRKHLPPCTRPDTQWVLFVGLALRK